MGQHFDRMRERFLANVNTQDRSQCWTWIGDPFPLWLGSKLRNIARPKKSDHGPRLYAVGYLLFRGPIPRNRGLKKRAGLYRVCQGHRCVNPWHVEKLEARDLKVMSMAKKTIPRPGAEGVAEGAASTV